MGFALLTATQTKPVFISNRPEKSPLYSWVSFRRSTKNLAQHITILETNVYVKFALHIRQIVAGELAEIESKLDMMGV